VFVGVTVGVAVGVGVTVGVAVGVGVGDAVEVGVTVGVPVGVGVGVTVGVGVGVAVGVGVGVGVKGVFNLIKLKSVPRTHPPSFKFDGTTLIVLIPSGTTTYLPFKSFLPMLVCPDS
jgi:hypothetical protein